MQEILPTVMGFHIVLISMLITLTYPLNMEGIRQLKYFFGIEVARGAEVIVLSQRKYALDSLKETCMLGCKPAVVPIDPKTKLGVETGEPVDRERYQMLVGRLIYLSRSS
jgi:hypothetical protein